MRYIAQAGNYWTHVALDRAFRFAGSEIYCPVIVGLLEGAMIYQPSPWPRGPRGSGG